MCTAKNFCIHPTALSLSDLHRQKKKKKKKKITWLEDASFCFDNFTCFLFLFSIWC